LKGAPADCGDGAFRRVAGEREALERAKAGLDAENAAAIASATVSEEVGKDAVRFLASLGLWDLVARVSAKAGSAGVRDFAAGELESALEDAIFREDEPEALFISGQLAGLARRGVEIAAGYGLWRIVELIGSARPVAGAEAVSACAKAGRWAEAESIATGSGSASAFARFASEASKAGMGGLAAGALRRMPREAAERAAAEAARAMVSARDWDALMEIARLPSVPAGTIARAREMFVRRWGKPSLRQAVPPGKGG
jgi:hypothetical protein